MKDENIIISGNKKYVTVGKEFGILLSDNSNELPLNEIDKKIITLIEQDTILIHLKECSTNNISEEMVHHCDANCNDLDSEIKNYLDYINKIIEKSYEDKRKPKWDSLERKYLLGFYRPYHFYEEDHGIYIKINGLIQFIRDFRNRILLNPQLYGTPDNISCYLISKTFTFFHEYYHHKIETLATRFEITTRLPHYTKGFHCLYCLTFGTEYCLEEAFANVYAYYETIDFLTPYLPLMRLNKNQLKLILKKEQIEQSPPGYNTAAKIISDNKDDAKSLEYFFFECLLKYSFKLNTGFNLDKMDESYWSLFTHATHPLMNTNNDVTYIIESDESNVVNVRYFMSN